MLSIHQSRHSIVLSSTVHQIGFVVLIQTFCPGTRWLEVETRPSNDDSLSTTMYWCSYNCRLADNMIRTEIPFQSGCGQNSAINSDGEQSTRFSK